MTGFLRRLASGVLHTEPAIHPEVGSMWSAPRAAEPVESSGEILVPPPSRPADHGTSSPLEPIRDTTTRETAPHPQTEQPAIHGTQPESSVAEAPTFKTAFKPLVPLSQPHAFAAPPTPRHALGASLASAPARNREAVLPAGPAAPPQTAHPQPSLHAQSSRLPISTSRISAPLPPAAREPAPSRPPQRAQPPASEPDSIEIHIGRIEVLAASPPPPQPAPQPARKSLDLAEYLRRDRRTR